MTMTDQLDIHHNPGTALVLGGGGSTGNAWLIGVVAGLFDAGLDITHADVTVGTSAGSTAAAQLASSSPTALFAEILAAASATRPAFESATAGTRPVDDHLERMRRIVAASAGIADMRREMGAAALEREAKADGSWQARWRATVSSRLPGAGWPHRRILITAIDAESGEPVVFDRESGVDIVDAVAASCSSGLPYTIGDTKFLDGGYRSNADNADLAAGYARVLVLAPFGGRSLAPADWRTDLATQIDSLRAAGSRVETVFPRPDDEGLFGANAMNPTLRAPAARAGYERGRAGVERLRDLWRGRAER